MDRGYKVWVSSLSKIDIDAFILAMFPKARESRDQSYLNMIEVLGKEKIRKFIFIVEQEKNMVFQDTAATPTSLFKISINPRTRSL